ncbi:ABC transporter substrate-binding protein [Limnochorda pilosa]|uniref:ABC transporter substrate-binding protein n=1 Tax=Limnochorda pilosa TaxID=1555112 RepID=A0A0K2SJE9_LIMPI|nr:ABC transporter substrate-binding protein [Limnochorda pilosa]BAS27210.1 ABC transporter substrate-binding protein [Limnochorda pilosa]
MLNPHLRRVVAAVVTLLGVFGGVGLGAPAAAQDVVRLGTLKLIGGAPIYVALDKGFFEAEGLRVDVQWFAAAAPIATAVASGDIDVGATGITAALYNAVAAGSKIWLVADRGSEHPGYRLNALVTSRARYEGGLRQVADLRGKRVGITTLGSTYHYQIAQILATAGLGLRDVELVPLRSMSIMIDAVKEGTVDAAILSPPWGANAEEEGWGKVVFWAGEIPYQVTGVFVSNRFRENRDLAVRFLRAYVRGVRYYSDAVLTDPHGARYDEVLAIVARYTEQTPDVIAKSLSYIDRDGLPDVDDLLRQQEWYHANAMQSRIVPVEDFVDLSLVREAVAGL